MSDAALGPSSWVMIETAHTRVGARIKEWLLARDLDLIGSLLLIALLVLAFLEIGDMAFGDPRSIDASILLALREPHDLSDGIGPPRVTDMMRDITALGSGTLAAAFSLALVGWLLLTGRPGAAIFVILAVVGAWVINDVLKDTFGRARPEIVPHLMRATNESFPSGHTMISAVLYPTQAGIFGRLVRQRRLRFYLMGLAIATAVLVGFSRIYLGVHYPSDVLGGLCIGFAWALACGIAVRLLQRHDVFRSRPKDEPAPPEAEAKEQVMVEPSKPSS